jgi:hypothetical protein
MKKIAINVETLKVAAKYNSSRLLRDIIQACRATPAQVRGLLTERTSYMSWHLSDPSIATASHSLSLLQIFSVAKDCIDDLANHFGSGKKFSAAIKRRITNIATLVQETNAATPGPVFIEYLSKWQRFAIENFHEAEFEKLVLELLLRSRCAFDLLFTFLSVCSKNASAFGSVQQRMLTQHKIMLEGLMCAVLNQCDEDTAYRALVCHDRPLPAHLIPHVSPTDAFQSLAEASFGNSLTGNDSGLYNSSSSRWELAIEAQALELIQAPGFRAASEVMWYGDHRSHRSFAQPSVGKIASILFLRSNVRTRTGKLIFRWREKWRYVSSLIREYGNSGCFPKTGWGKAMLTVLLCAAVLPPLWRGSGGTSLADGPPSMHLFGQIVSDTTMHRTFWGAAAAIGLLTLGRAEFALQIALWLALATAQLMIAVATAIRPLILVLSYVLSAVVCTVGLPFDALGLGPNTYPSPGYGGTGVMAAIRYMDTDHWLRVRRRSIVPVSCIVSEISSPHFKASTTIFFQVCFAMVMIWQLDERRYGAHHGMSTADVVVYTWAFADVVALCENLVMANANVFKLKLLPLAHCGLFAAAFAFRLLILLKGLPIDDSASGSDTGSSAGSIFGNSSGSFDATLITGDLQSKEAQRWEDTFLGVGALLSIFRIFTIFVLHRFIGPLYLSIIRVFRQVAVFGFLTLLFIVSFAYMLSYMALEDLEIYHKIDSSSYSDDPTNDFDSFGSTLIALLEGVFFDKQYTAAADPMSDTDIGAHVFNFSIIFYYIAAFFLVRSFFQAIILNSYDHVLSNTPISELAQMQKKQEFLHSPLLPPPLNLALVPAYCCALLFVHARQISTPSLQTVVNWCFAGSLFSTLITTMCLHEGCGKEGFDPHSTFEHQFGGLEAVVIIEAFVFCRSALWIGGTLVSSSTPGSTSFDMRFDHLAIYFVVPSCALMLWAVFSDDVPGSLQAWTFDGADSHPMLGANKHSASSTHASVGSGGSSSSSSSTAEPLGADFDNVTSADDGADTAIYTHTSTYPDLERAFLVLALLCFLSFVLFLVSNVPKCIRYCGCSRRRHIISTDRSSGLGSPGNSTGARNGGYSYSYSARPYQSVESSISTDEGSQRVAIETYVQGVVRTLVRSRLRERQQQRESRQANHTQTHLPHHLPAQWGGGSGLGGAGRTGGAGVGVGGGWRGVGMVDPSKYRPQGQQGQMAQQHHQQHQQPLEGQQQRGQRQPQQSHQQRPSRLSPPSIAPPSRAFNLTESPRLAAQRTQSGHGFVPPLQLPLHGVPPALTRTKSDIPNPLSRPWTTTPSLSSSSPSSSSPPPSSPSPLPHSSSPSSLHGRSSSTDSGLSGGASRRSS